MAVGIMFLMRYDMDPVESHWRQMTADKTHAVAAVGQPNYEIEVHVKARREFEEGKWGFRLDDSDAVFATAAEDLV